MKPRLSFLSLALAVAQPLHAGIFTASAWTGDDSAGVSPIRTLWAYSFGSPTGGAIDGVPLAGIDGANPSVPGDFSITGMDFVFNGDSNDLTALGGTGSAVMAGNFLYGGNPGTIVLSGLVAGKSYSASIYGVGFNAPDPRTSTFSSGGDGLAVDENSLGTDKGIRVEYAFTATAATQTITITPDTTSTFHVYGLSLTGIPFLVTTAADSGAGSLRQALADAAASAGPDEIIFAPALSGGRISLASELVISDTGGVTIDGSDLSPGVTVSGERLTRILNVQSGAIATVKGLTLAEGRTGGYGGAAFVSGELGLRGCTLMENEAPDGGSIWQQGAASTLLLDQCTLVGNRATGPNATGGIVSTGGATAITRCTFSGNAGTGTGGALYLQSPAAVSVEQSIVAGNSDPNHPDIYKLSGTLIASGANLIGSNSSVTTEFPAGPLAGTTANPIEPLLSPPAYFGGPAMTLHPLFGSPAIDAAGAVDPGGTDQRGFARFTDGDGDGSAALDIGAVESGPGGSPPGGPFLRVTTLNDEDDGFPFSSLGAGTSLREAVKYAPAGAVITFEFVSGFETSPVILTLGEIVVEKSLFIDASPFVDPVTISGNQAGRVFNIAPGAVVAMQNLTVRDGRTADGLDWDDPANPDFGDSSASGTDAENGGGMLNAGSLSMIGCWILSNETGKGGDGDGTFDHGGGRSGDGAGITSSGWLLLDSCVVAHNMTGHEPVTGVGGNGGGVSAESMLLMRSCEGVGNMASGAGGFGYCFGGVIRATGSTFRGNAASESGAFLFSNLAVAKLARCTLSGNAAEGTGAAAVNLGSSLELDHCTIAANTAGSGSAGGIFNRGSVVANHSIIAGNSPINIGFNPVTGSGNLIDVDPMLAPLSDYGGPHFTMLPIPGSPAIDAATGSTAMTDQRGLPVSGTPDIGAVESQPELTGFTDTDSDGMDDRLEPLYGFVVGEPDGMSDADGDGSSNADELGNRTGPRDPASLFRITGISKSGNQVTVTYTTFPGLNYVVHAGPDFNFAADTIGYIVPAPGFTRSATFTVPGGAPKYFFRAERQ